MAQRTDYLGPLTDSRRWDQINIRPDDVIVVTPPKSGTTWMQTIVALLISGDPDVDPELSVKMPWVDIRFRPIAEIADRLEAMPNRRCMKSHTPLDGLPLDEQAQYICVFRHPLDAHFSFRNHVRNMPMSLLDNWYPHDDSDNLTFHHFLTGTAQGRDCDAMPLAHILHHYKTAKALADRPNVSLFHYADMKRDLADVFARVSALIAVSHSAPLTKRLIQVATFDHMQQNAERYAPAGGKGFFLSDAQFFHSSAHGKWHGQLSEDDLAAYDAIMDAHLAPDDRRWLEYGSV